MTIQYKGLTIEVENGDVEINGDTIIFRGKEDKVVYEHHYHNDNETVHYPWWVTPLPQPTVPIPQYNPPHITWCNNS